MSSYHIFKKRENWWQKWRIQWKVLGMFQSSFILKKRRCALIFVTNYEFDFKIWKKQKTIFSIIAMYHIEIQLSFEKHNLNSY